jgi:hypothetical protein
VLVAGGICENLQNLIPAGSGYTLQSAKGINNKGQIVVEARPPPLSRITLFY